MKNPNMTAEDFVKILNPTAFTMENIVETIKKAYNEGYSNGATYAFQTCSVNIN